MHHIDEQIDKIVSALRKKLDSEGILFTKPKARKTAPPAARSERSATFVHVGGHIENLNLQDRSGWSAEARDAEDKFAAIDACRRDKASGHLMSGPIPAGIEPF